MFCEWVYVVDLDEYQFEVYGGATTKNSALTTRWNEVGGKADHVPNLIRAYHMAQLPQTLPEFIYHINKALQAIKKHTKKPEQKHSSKQAKREPENGDENEEEDGDENGEEDGDDKDEI
jgi:hypothetical protein